MAFLTIGPEQLRDLMPMSSAIDTLEESFRNEKPTVPPRQRVMSGSGELLIMPAISTFGLGVKLVTINRLNRLRGLPAVQGTYTLFSAIDLAPVAVIDAAALTVLRTGATSGLATRLLARPEARSLVIFGTGPQAHSHLVAMCAVCPVEEVTIVPRSRNGVDALAEHGRDLGLGVRIAGPDSVADADLVCTCTSSPTPVFDGSKLREGTHINAIGSYHPDTRELDEVTMKRGLVVVEDRETALAEAGDLLIPMSQGIMTETHIASDLSQLVRGRPVRRSLSDITIFKSVGMALEDLTVAIAVYDRIRGVRSSA